MSQIKPQVNFAFNRQALPLVRSVDYHQLMVESFQAGKVIKDALRRLKRTQGWLAAQMDVSDAAVSKWIRKGTIAREHVARLADLLEVPASMLLCGRDEQADVAESTSAAIRREVRIDTLRRVFSALADEFGVEIRDLLAADERERTTPYAPALPPARPSMHEDRASFAAEAPAEHPEQHEVIALRHRERRS